MTPEMLEQRIATLEQLVASLQQQVALVRLKYDDGEAPIELTEDLKAEIERRLADADANPDDSVSWEEVKAAALSRFQQK